MVTKSHPVTVVCPHCGDMAPRVKRKLRDRMISLLTPVKRYRCDYCDWSATFLTSGAPDPEAPDRS